MGQLTKAALICGGGSMFILVSILIKMPLVLQILLLLVGLAISVYGVFLLVKMIANPSDKMPTAPPDTVSVIVQKKKKGPTSTL
ncbi:hypothetical protein ACIQ2D_20305 [Lysinibacillus sp. NPDC097287]|uniref:hypothetical protein n=1 Tax=Lysinibacillus sp. NPDC097287 TaxID=3364144 RepID=UPI003815F0FB